MKIVAVQFNPIVGDIANNVAKMTELAKKANAEAIETGADLIVFGECATVGYPVEDLVYRKAFVDEAEYQTKIFIENTKDLETAVVFGSIEAASKGAYNIALISKGGKIVGKHRKNVRANGYMFDEIRTFKKGTEDDADAIIDVGPVRYGVIVCEDFWHPDLNEFMKATYDIDVLVVINGSPYETGKHKVREEIAQKRHEETGVDIAYVNLVGGQDSAVFDGASFLVTGGVVSDRAPAFEEGVFTLDFNSYGKGEVDTMEQDYLAAVIGLRDFVHKQGFEKVVLGLSGGLDSSIVAAMAADALGGENVTAISLPTKYSSDGSKDDAEKQANFLGLDYRIIEVEPIVESLRSAYQSQVIPRNEEPQDFSKKLTGVADENIQARARANILLAISNQEGHMLLGTSNRSELYVGYGTYGGDLAGFFNPVQDFYKSYLFGLARWRNYLPSTLVDRLKLRGPAGEVIPYAVIDKPPSAELSPGQKDTDSLPEYSVLDAIIDHIVTDLLSVEDIVRKGYDRTVVERINNLIYRAEFKRRQGPPGPRISNTHINVDRRYPIVNKFR